MFLLMISRCRK